MIGRLCPFEAPSTNAGSWRYRPGMGGSTPVPLKIRMKVWLETVPALLRKLGVEHVSLFSHSAGTMYALNTLVHHRSILDPKAPYMAFLGQ